MTRNWKYKVDDTTVVLTSEEDKYVTEQIKKGASIVYLRNGELAINVSFIRYKKETDSATEKEEEESKRLLGLPPRRMESLETAHVGGEELRRLSESEFLQKMGWMKDEEGHIRNKR